VCLTCSFRCRSGHEHEQFQINQWGTEGNVWFAFHGNLLPSFPEGSRNSCRTLANDLQESVAGAKFEALEDRPEGFRHRSYQSRFWEKRGETFLPIGRYCGKDRFGRGSSIFSRDTSIRRHDGHGLPRFGRTNKTTNVKVIDGAAFVPVAVKN